MALESTFVPIPSEMIIPPAAYVAHTQGGMSWLGIVIAGTLGSWVGASLMYWGARALGRPLVMRYGPYVGLSQAKIELAEHWSARYESTGVFFSRLLPVIRTGGALVRPLRIDRRILIAPSARDSPPHRYSRRHLGAGLSLVCRRHTGRLIAVVLGPGLAGHIHRAASRAPGRLAAPFLRPGFRFRRGLRRPVLLFCAAGG